MRSPLRCPSLTVLALAACGAPGESQRSPVVPQAGSRVDAPVVAPQDPEALRAEELREQLYVLYGVCRQRLEERKIRFVVDEQLRRAAERDPSLPVEERRRRAYDVEARVDAELARVRADFARRFPELDPETELRRAFRSEAWFRDQLRLTFVFDGLFLAADPASWPPETRLALQNRIGADYERELAGWRLPDGSFLPQYAVVLRQCVRDDLFARLQIASGLTLADPALALSADADRDGRADLVVRTAELWSEVEPLVSARERDEARRFCRALAATRARLQAAGAWLSDDELELAWVELDNQLSEWVPSVEALAVQQERFPSVEAYRAYHDLLTCFARGPYAALPGSAETHVADRKALTDARLAGATAAADVLLVSDYDFPRASWKADGSARAWQRAQAWRAQWEQRVAGGSSPAELDALWSGWIDAHSEWWDPPLPANVSRSELQIAEYKRGRFEEADIWQWRDRLGLSRVDEWLAEPDVLADLFADLPLGALGGPYPHAFGALLVRVRARGAPAEPLDLSQPAQRAAAERDRLESAFRAYTRAALEAARPRR